MRKYCIFFLGLLLLAAACKKTGAGGDALGPSIGISPNVGLAGTIVTITGKGFGRDTGAVRVSFNGTPAVVQLVTDTMLLVTVPDGKTGPVTVSRDGRQVTGPTYTYQNVSVTSISPASGPSGIIDTLFGTGLNYTGKSESQLPAVYFNGKLARLIGADSGRLLVIVPDTPGIGPVSVILGDLKVTGPVFHYFGIVSISPKTGNVGTTVSVNGGFGSNYASAAVTINGMTAAVTSASESKLVVTVPAGDTTGPVSVKVNGQTLAGPTFTFVPPPTVASVVPSSGPAGTRVTITGNNFSAVGAENTVSFNGVPATLVGASATQLQVVSPAGAGDGPISIVVNGQSVTGPIYKYQNLGITAINPAAALPPCSVTLSGFGFGTVAANDIVAFNGVTVPVTSVVDTQIVVNLPASITTGLVTVQVGTLTANGPVFVRSGVSTIAGGTQGLNNGVGTAAQFMSPAGLAMDAAGNVYVADAVANNIRKIAPDGTVSNFAGDPSGGAGSSDGLGSAAAFSQPEGLAIDAGGNLYVADFGNGSIRKIAHDGTVSTLIPSGTVGEPWGICVDKSGNIYVDDYTQYVNTVYKFSAAGNQISSTVVDVGPVPYYPNLEGLAVDNGGNFYVVDRDGDGIFLNMEPWYADGSFSRTADRGLCMDNSGNLVIGNGILNQVNVLNPQTKTLSNITGGGGSTIAGFQDGSLAAALFNDPVFVLVDAQGNIYVSDQGNYAIRKISLH